jgi:hypothetical protein
VNLVHEVPAGSTSASQLWRMWIVDSSSSLHSGGIDCRRVVPGIQLLFFNTESNCFFLTRNPIALVELEPVHIGGNWTQLHVQGCALCAWLVEFTYSEIHDECVDCLQHVTSLLKHW